MAGQQLPMHAYTGEAPPPKQHEPHDLHSLHKVHSCSVYILLPAQRKIVRRTAHQLPTQHCLCFDVIRHELRPTWHWLMLMRPMQTAACCTGMEAAAAAGSTAFRNCTAAGSCMRWASCNGCRGSCMRWASFRAASSVEGTAAVACVAGPCIAGACSTSWRRIAPCTMPQLPVVSY